MPEPRLPNQDVTVAGTIIDVPQMSEGKLRFTVDNVVINDTKIKGKVRLAVLPEFFGDNFSDELFAPGYRIAAVAKLREPVMFRNPGVYSYDLKREGVVASGYIKHIRLSNSGGGILTWIHRTRQRLGQIIDNSLSAENASFHKAIIPGLKGGISRDMRDAFSSTGLAHLLSISGTHFGLLAFIIFKFIRVTVRYLPVTYLRRMTLYVTPTQIAIILTLPLLTLYAVISGFSTPTVRALIMVFIYMFALLIGRKGQWLNSLSIAAVIILFWQPDALFELSFQLSFLAVFSIGCFLEPRDERNAEDPPLTLDTRSSHFNFVKEGIKRIREKIKTVLIITLAAVAGTAPVVALAFKQFPLISPVTNIVVTPLVCFVILPIGFFTGFGALLFGMQAMPLHGLTDAVTGIALKLVNTFSDIPFSNFHVHNPSIAAIVLYYFSLIFIVKSRGRWRFLPFAVVISLYLIAPYLSADKMRVTFLDTGQGDASVVELPDGRVMLIDGGINDPDMGRSVIAPYLWSKGIRGIDYMVMSHPHPDHYGGLIYIIDNFGVREIWTNGRVLPGAGEFFQKLMEKEIPFRVLKRGDMLDAGEYRIYILHPYEGFYADSSRGEFSNQNSDSLVLKVESDNVSILFTGDIEVEAEEDLIHLGQWLKSDIIKVPHHGSRTSNSMAFIQTVSPQIAVVSAGWHNTFGHPHEETVARYRNAGARLFRTDTDGAIVVTVKDDSYEIKTYRDVRLRKVRDWQDEIKNIRLLF